MSQRNLAHFACVRSIYSLCYHVKTLSEHAHIVSNSLQFCIVLRAIICYTCFMFTYHERLGIISQLMGAPLANQELKDLFELLISFDHVETHDFAHARAEFLLKNLA